MSDAYRIIANGAGSGDAQRPPSLTDEIATRIYSWMVRLRTFDERAVSLQRQGRLGTYPPFWGEEGTQAGPAAACRSSDWFFPSYRQSAIGIVRGLPPSTIFKYRRGFGGNHGFWNAREYRVAPMIVPIATQIPHAVGLAWAAKLRGDDVAALVWFGDGATSEGDFHEGLNFAAVTKAPVVLFCVNNQWAISTPVHRQTATKTIEEKGAAYGIPSIRVDGFDPVACWQVTSEALDRARSGNGPALIEALTYRLAPHATADDPSLYRDASVTERWKELEPVARMRSWLERSGILEGNEIDEIHAAARREIAHAVEEADHLTETPPEIMFEHLYASGRPHTFDEGLAELRAAGR